MPWIAFPEDQRNNGLRVIAVEAATCRWTSAIPMHRRRRRVLVSVGRLFVPVGQTG